MLKELYTAAMGMMPQQTRLEVAANNIANASTTGFKRSSVFERNLIDARAMFNNVPENVEQNDPPVGSYTDFAQGAEQQTNNPLDIAIENKNGFFVLQDGDGQQFLTKAGHFTISKDGSIEAMDGKLLMGMNGPLNINREFITDKSDIQDTRSISIKISDNGEVFCNSAPVGTILLANVDNVQSLENISNSNFVPTANTNANYIDEKDVSLRQGWLENSNVNIVNEMVNMIELQRAFEAGQKVIQTNNDTLDSTMKVGKFY